MYAYAADLRATLRDQRPLKFFNFTFSHFSHESISQFFLVSDQSICHCYADLKPFHCEEEEGVDLLPVNCIEHKKVPNSRPLLTMLSRSASTLSPKATPRHSKSIVSKKISHEGELCGL